MSRAPFAVHWKWVLAGSFLVLAAVAVISGLPGDAEAPRAQGTVTGVATDAPASALPRPDPSSQIPAPIAEADVQPDKRLVTHLSRLFRAVPGSTYEVTNLGVQYESLRQAANRGDLIAARTLHRALLACPANLPRDAAELAQLRVQIDSGERSAFRMPDESPHQGHARLSALLGRCGMLPAGAHEPQYALIAQLAAAGDHEARLRFPFSDRLIDGRAPDAAQRRAAHARLALEYVESELAAGNPEALRAMDRIYAEGRLLPADPVLSYAYAYAATFAPGDHRILLETLPAQAAGLDAEQRARAEQLARDIYQRCCS